MSFQVLQNIEQIRSARDVLQQRQLSSLPSPALRIVARAAARLGMRQPLILGDYIKSWDVLQSVEFLETHLERDQAILDIGAYASEILVALHKAGFTNLTGVDLNPRLGEMPYADNIRYVTSDFMNTPFEDQSFQAITSISVVEHGYNPDLLFTEVSRLLKTGGYFVASFDYWREKIDTANTRFFDMDWLIFSEPEVEAMISVARKHGLEPAGKFQPQTADRAIQHGGYKYTFGWIVLQRHS